MAKVTVEGNVALEPTCPQPGRAAMLATKVICPHCSKHLKTSKPLQPGHRVLCPRCGRSFAVPPSADAVSPSPQPVPPQPEEDTEKRISLRADPAQVETAPDVELPAQPADKRQMLWIGLILGGLLLLMTMTLGLVLYFATRKGPTDTPVATTTTSPTENGNSLPAATSERDREPPLVPETSKPQPEAESERWLPPEEQEQVNKAIDRGVQWLEKCQGPDGAWGPRVGLAALPALTLLECGVPADDLHIQKALQHVRKAIPTLKTTYDLSLAILLLDRLGDPADKKLIQTCALRLVAGQAASGGWTYNCPVLPPQQEMDLLTVMRARRPKSSLDLFVGGPGGSAPPGFIARDPKSPLGKDLQSEPSAGSKLLPEEGTGPLDKDLLSPAEVKSALDRLPVPLRELPSLQPPQQSHKMPRGDITDNSNTQFAILGLLAAGHYDLPLQRTYALIVQRFHVSQVPDGRWNYQYSSPGRPADFRPAMTGSGLLGLAVQYGLAADHASGQGKARRIDDPAVEKGFHYLAQVIGKPIGWKKPRNRRRESINLYLLWTIERCGVLYKRRIIEGKDWYQWGAELLLDNQEADGSWNKDGYYTPPNMTPITDTCFALLFLKRANLAKELTKKVEFFMEGKKLQTTP
jgi:hypothetical protein